MELGSILVGVAIILVVSAYVARPFRRVRVDYNKAVEAWAATVRLADTPVVESLVDSPPMPVHDAPLISTVQQPDHAVGTQQVNFCPYCGRRAKPDHRFCTGCGKPLHDTAEGV